MDAGSEQHANPENPFPTAKVYTANSILVGATAVILAVAFLLSDTNWRGLPIAYTAMAYGLIRHYQGARIDAHIIACSGL